MNRFLKAGMVGLGLGVILPATIGGAAPQASTMGQVETAKIADTLVKRCAAIQSGELVLITGGAQDQQLLEDIAVEIRTLGAHPLIALGSDRLSRKLITDVDARFDRQEPAFSMKLAEIVDAIINVDFSERPDLWADIPSQRLIDRRKSMQAVDETMLQRGVVQVELGNGLYPTPALARQFGISQTQLSKIFWDGVNTKYDKLQATGARVKDKLQSGRKVRVTASNGTDLTVEIAKRPAFVSDGMVSLEDRYEKGPACQVWLPAGEVYVTPVRGTANGKFIADTYFFEGQLIKGLTLTFTKGKLTSMTADSDITALRERYDAAPAGREFLAVIDIGLNPDIRPPSGSRVVTWMGAGNITIGVGNNTWAGGSNDVPYSLFAHLVGGSLTVDDKPIVERGTLLDK